jgi:uncharacterized protein (TIGR02118 family)
MTSPQPTAWALEISGSGTPDVIAPAQSWVASRIVPALAHLPGLTRADIYRPAAAQAKDPFVHDGMGPVALLMIYFRDLSDLEAAMCSTALDHALTATPDGVALTVMGLQRKFYPLQDGSFGTPDAAPLSYVVRYHRPADDEKAFVEHYAATHPPLLAHLPRIRAIACYFPLDALCHARLPSADYMIGNEVFFDTMDDFNAAMASPQRRALREHFEGFPRFTGRNVHHAMNREAILNTQESRSDLEHQKSRSDAG